jgi:hypothetical protein
MASAQLWTAGGHDFGKNRYAGSWPGSGSCKNSRGGGRPLGCLDQGGKELEQFAELSAIVSAMADTYLVGRDTYAAFFARRRAAPDYVDRGRVLQGVYSTYSDGEVEAIRQRIERYRDRFIEEGSGEARRKCLCSVLRDVKAGNGGSIPIPEWDKIFDQLHG